MAFHGIFSTHRWKPVTWSSSLTDRRPAIAVRMGCCARPNCSWVRPRRTLAPSGVPRSSWPAESSLVKGHCRPDICRQSCWMLKRFSDFASINLLRTILLGTHTYQIKPPIWFFAIPNSIPFDANGQCSLSVFPATAGPPRHSPAAKGQGAVCVPFSFL